MKPKHVSLITIVFAICVAIAALWLGFRQNEYLLRSSGMDPITPLADIPAPDKAALSQMDHLERNLSMLASPPPQFRRQADLSAFGYREVLPVARKQSFENDGTVTASKHRLTLAFKGHAKSFCVIDNQLYPEGAELPDGATIVRIESRRVLIANKSIQSWLTINPLGKESVPSDS